MAEELTLTDPVVVPEKVTDTYSVSALTLDSVVNAEMALPPAVSTPGMVLVTVRDNFGVTNTHRYTGQLAQDMIKYLNTGDFTVESMHRKILQKLSLDGLLVGTVSGTPEPPPSEDPFKS